VGGGVVRVSGLPHVHHSPQPHLDSLGVCFIHQRQHPEGLTYLPTHPHTPRCSTTP
jgi:hypothetical protein